ncbi:hypothetical protein ABPG77_000391 [Micractinium sp. CCAP 211/92]
MWSWLLWGRASASAQPSSASTTPARAIPVYGSQEVESALLMAAQSLAIKNRAIDALQAQLESATACLAVAREQGSHASLVTDAARQQVMASAVDAARAAEVAQLQGRCHSAEQQVAAVTMRLADAQALSKQQALDIASAHERSAAVKRQLAAVKAELAEAKAAQASAVTALVELEAALADLREESRSLRQEKEELQAMLTARESAYLTLLETVQDLFRRHSPSSSGEQTPEEDGGQQEDLGQRLQHKLQEWQQRLQSAAKLRSLSRGGSRAVEASATSLRSCAAAAAEAGAAGGPGSACSSTASGAACSERSGRFGSPAGSGSSLDRAHASAVQAAIEAAAHTGASGGSSASSSSTTMEGTLPVPAVVVSLPTLTDVLGRMPDAAADVEHSSCSSSSSSSSSSSPRIPASHAAMPAAAATVPAAVRDTHGRPASRVTAAPAAARVAGSAPSGSRIKRLGMQAANLRDGGKPLPRPEWALSSLPGAVSAQAAAAATPARAAAKAWTPGR